MQRLLSMKLASNLPKNLSTSTTTTQSSTLFHFQPHKTSSLTKPPQNLLFSSLHHQHNLSHKIHGFLSNPLLRNHISLDSAVTLLRVSIKKLSHGRLAFLQRRTPKQINSQFIPISNCQECARRRSWFQGVSSDDMVWGLILANVAVFCLWKIADRTFMYKHFVTSLLQLKYNRLHTLITSEFSHGQFGHIVFNMFGLYLFGTNIGRAFGPGFLLKLYLAGAIGGSVFYLVHKAYLYSLILENRGLDIKRNPLRAGRRGASGAVTAIILLDIFLHPRATFYFIIPVPAMLLGMFLLGQDSSSENGGLYTGESARLGGATVALIAWARLRMGLRVF